MIPKLLFACAIFAVSYTAYAKELITTGKHTLNFIQNKGQVTDQHGRPRQDIDYKIDAGGMTIFVGAGQLHYQWFRNEKPLSTTLEPQISDASAVSGKPQVPPASKTETYRMDIELVGADKNVTAIAEGKLPYEEHYYTAQFPAGLTATSYSKVTYKNVYPNIDWVLYINNNTKQQVPEIKYDFVVHPGGDVSKIKLRYSGATRLVLVNGTLVATTPFGSISEDAPYSYMAGGREQVSSAYVLKDNCLSFSLPAINTMLNEPLVIDPSVRWATYYGGSNSDWASSVKADTAGNAYICGMTQSTINIATSGAHQTTLDNRQDGFIAKFDIDGVRQWATYYGGDSTDFFNSITLDNNNIIVTGTTQSSNSIATTGAYQTALKLFKHDAMLVKLSNNGTRLWGTYYGSDTAVDQGTDVACDADGNIYIVGDFGANMATIGAFQGTSIYGGLLSKFDGNGNRLWATYYNGEIESVTVDALKNIYIAGWTTATSNVATTGAHQTVIGAFPHNDGFIAKFNSGGTRLWGTYYGGSDHDYIDDLACDEVGNLYACGLTGSFNAIATAGSHQPTFAGDMDVFLVKLNSSGARQWATYYGGIHSEYGASITIDYKNNIYIGTTAYSVSGLTTVNAHQPTHNGGALDAVMGVFNSSGILNYGTYYGGASGDWNGSGSGTGFGRNGGGAIAFGKNKVYLAGGTTSTANIATLGAHQSSNGGGGGDGFLVQFELDSFLFIEPPLPQKSYCSGDTMKIRYNVTRPFRSTNTFTIELSNSSGNFSSATTLATVTAQTGGTVNWTVPATVSAGSGYKVRVRSSAPADTAFPDMDITLTPRPVIAVNANTPVCSGSDLQLNAGSTSTGVTWTWAGPNGFSSTAKDPLITATTIGATGDYVLTATKGSCIVTDTVNVLVKQSPVISGISSNSPICANSDLLLTVNTNEPTTTWIWTGPKGFTDVTQNPVRTNARLADSGVYSVTGTWNSCSISLQTHVKVLEGPTAFVYASPGDSICTGQTATFVGVANNAGVGAQYQWVKNGMVIAGANTLSYTPPAIANNDTFSFRVIPGAGAVCATTVNSIQVPMTVLPYLAPQVTMTASDTNAWPGLQVDFIATATDAGKNPKYQWKLNGVNVQGAISNKWGYAGLKNGDEVCIEVTSSYLCPQPAKVIACKKVKIATGIANIETDGIEVFPNPADGQLTIKGPIEDNLIQIFDVVGREIYNTVAKQNVSLIATKAWTDGTYILQLSNKNGKIIRKKIVISR